MAGNGATYRYLAYRRRKRNGNHKGMPRWMTALLILGVVMLTGAAVMAGVGYGVYRSYADDLVPPDEAIAKLPRGGARIYDRNGALLYEFLNDYGLRDPVEIEDISLLLIAATIATEDSSFKDNPGVNFKGLAAAAWDNFSPFDSTPGVFEGRGGSSITQQLVKNVYFTQEEREDRSTRAKLERKLKETAYALELTRQYSKEQIMEWYLNQISYGNVFIGIEAASDGYFGKDAKDLTLAEAALLAAIPSCPSCYDPINKPEAAVAQRNFVLQRMYEEDYITAAQAWVAAAEPLTLAPKQFNIEAPHFVLDVIKPELERLYGEEALLRDGLEVYTSLDLNMQNQGQQILEEQITTFESSGGHNGAVVAMDPKTAEILVYIGSRDYFNEEIEGKNDMADALNSPGSSFKPFTYITAFMNLGWGPGSMILDTPINVGRWWDGANPPRNPGTGYQGPITARNALGNSLNIPAIKTILYTGVGNVITQARKMGITSLDDPTLYGPSLTVGGVDVKLADMVYGYTVFPNLGMLKGVTPSEERAEGNRQLDPVSILRVENRDGNVLYPIIDGQPAERPVPQEVRVAPAPEAFMINDILSDGCAQSITFGGCGALSIPGRPLAIKTGTSEPYEQTGLIGDTWAIGYTPQLVVGSWFGNADNTPMTNISSTSVSWRTVREFAIAFHENLPVEQFSRPEGLARASVCMPSGLKPGSSCGKTTAEDYFAVSSLPTRDDDWWTTGRIDTRTGQPATDNTPQQFVAVARTLRIPEGLPEFAREQALEWARVLRAGFGNDPASPDENDEQNIPIIITSPANAASVQGIATISGRASSPNFQSFRLEYQPAGDEDWTLINEGNEPVNGVLGNWDASSLAPGIYAIRLTVVDEQIGEISTRIDVLVLSTVMPTEEIPEATPEAGGPGGGRGHGGGRGPPPR